MGALNELSKSILNRSWPLSSRPGFGSWCLYHFSLATLPLASFGLSGTTERDTHWCLLPFYKLPVSIFFCTSCVFALNI